MTNTAATAFCQAIFHAETAPLWIDGKPSAGKNSFGVSNPADGKEFFRVGDATIEDCAQTIVSAQRAHILWKQTNPRERGEILARAAQKILEHSEELATLMSLELGRSLADSRAEVKYGAEFLRWYAEEAVRLYGRIYQAPQGDAEIQVLPEPVGVCLAVTPWNFPLAMATRKIGPALATGCSVIVKPAEETPLTAVWLAKKCAEVGLPSGVLSVLPTTSPAEIVAYLLTHPCTAKISFTGSTAVGKKLLKIAAEGVKKTSMELGGNAPCIICADADISQAVEQMWLAKMRNAGQACVAANRILVHTTILPKVLEKIRERMGELTIGDPLDPTNVMGPIVNRKQQQQLEKLVQVSFEENLTIERYHKALPEEGFFFAPTVITGCQRDSTITQTEIFGPIFAIQTFATDEEAIEEANATQYGLAGYIFTTSYTRARKYSRSLRAGIIGVNTGLVSDPAAPFGGFRESGIGKEGAWEGIQEYLNYKYVRIQGGESYFSTSSE